jgi:CheY-like chemotaxis protein
VVVRVEPGAAAATVEALKRLDLEGTPVVLYAPDELDADEERRLRTAVFGGQALLARNPDQLLEEASLLLHAPLDRLPEAARSRLAQARQTDDWLAGRRIVVIDDDIRNIFSLASALEDFGVELRYAESGRAGLDLLKETPEADAVLVDIMMPDMDGYETIREIRALPQFADLPVVAVTAKAMKGDRQKCIQAGASDYVSKPVDIDHLVSVLRVSIQRAARARAFGAAGDNIVDLMPAAS